MLENVCFIPEESLGRIQSYGVTLFSSLNFVDTAFCYCGEAWCQSYFLPTLYWFFFFYYLDTFLNLYTRIEYTYSLSLKFNNFRVCLNGGGSVTFYGSWCTFHCENSRFFLFQYFVPMWRNADYFKNVRGFYSSRNSFGG